MVWLNIDITPGALMIEAELNNVADQIKSFKVPLERSVREVMRYSLQENFHAEGRPDAWAPLADVTVAIKGFSNILLNTGALYRAAGQLNIWNIDKDSATIAGGNAAGSTQDVLTYGAYQQSGWSFEGWSDSGMKGPRGGTLKTFGTKNVPERPWAVIQDPEDYDAIQEIFLDWIMERFGASGWNDVDVGA